MNNVIESGSNANGRWIKYGDGTMICWGRGMQPANTSTIQTYIYPVEFKSGQRCFCNVSPNKHGNSATDATDIVGMEYTSTTQFYVLVRILNPNGTLQIENKDIYFYWLALETWK